MTNLFLKVIRKLLGFWFGKTKSQTLFEGIHKISISGMHFGYGAELETSGEIGAMHYVKTKIKNKPIIFDVGANEGQYAKQILLEFGTEISLHCFEPSSTTFKLLEAVIGKSSVQLYLLGFGEKKEQKTLFSHSEYSGLSSTHPRKLEYYNLNYDSRETVDIDTIDDFCAQHSIEKIDFLKLDIEGDELFALKGAEKMLRQKKIQFIQFEFGGCNIDSRTYFQDFWELLHADYTIYRILNNGFQEIKKYSEYCEIFLTINYLAELKNKKSEA